VNATNGNHPQICRQNIGDAEISYLLYEGKGPPLIFLHATGFQPWLWHPLAREIAGAYRIVAPSFCNQRESDPENGGLSWATLAEDTIRLCDALQLTRPFLAGHSMGATVNMIANAFYGLPAAGMVLIEEPIFLSREFFSAPRLEEKGPVSRSICQQHSQDESHDFADREARAGRGSGRGGSNL
jgi:lipase